MNVHTQHILPRVLSWNKQQYFIIDINYSIILMLRHSSDHSMLSVLTTCLLASTREPSLRHDRRLYARSHMPLVPLSYFEGLSLIMSVVSLLDEQLKWNSIITAIRYPCSITSGSLPGLRANGTVFKPRPWLSSPKLIPIHMVLIVASKGYSARCIVLLY